MNGYKTRVMLINDHLGWDGQVHGVGRMLQLWATYLDPDKFDVTVCILDKKDGLSRIFEERGIKTAFLGKGKYNPTTISGIVGLIRKEKIDILHTQGYRGSTFGRLAGLITGVPVLVHFHDKVEYYPLIQRVGDRLLKGMTDGYIAVSDSAKDFWVDRCKLDSNRITVMPNFTSLEEFKPLDAVRLKVERERLGIAPDFKVVGTIARLVEGKGVRYLLEAAPIVLRSFPKTMFIVVGDGPLRGELEDQANQLGLENNVVFTGFLEKVAPILGTFDIMAMPSIHREGCPLAALEAMAMGKPVITTTLIDILEDGVDGVVVPPRDSSALAGKLTHLLSNEDEAERLGTKGKEKSNKYDVKNSMRELEHIYSSLLSRNN